MSNNLFVLTDQEEETTPFGYDGMPAFKNEEKEAWRVLKVRIRNEDDLREFAEKLGQENITLKTKAIWYPALDKKENSLLRYIDEDQMDDFDIQEVIE
jgi:hypothetical protein